MFWENENEINYPSHKEIQKEALKRNLIKLPKLNKEKYTEIDSYWLKKGFNKVIIFYDEEKETSRYKIINPTLSNEEKSLKIELTKKLKSNLLKSDITKEKEKTFFKNYLKLVKRLKNEISKETFLKIYYYLRRDLVGYGRFQPFLDDRYLEDISCNGANIPVFVYHQRHGDLKSDESFSENELERLVMNIAERSGKRINFARPIVEATMPDGSRAQLSLGEEVTIKGSTITVRKFPEIPITPTDLIAWETLSPEMMAYLWYLAENKRNIMIVGGTASGKTTTLNAMTLFIPWGSKIVTIEDTHELRLPFENWVPSVTRPEEGSEAEDIDMYDLLRGALRQRPEYIIVGEIRGKEAVTLFQAMSTGHTSFSTLHAPNVERTITRLENRPINVPKSMIPTLDAIVVQSFTKEGDERKRRITEIQEIGNYDSETDSVQTNLLFDWKSSARKFERVSNSINLKLISEELGEPYEEIRSEVDIRAKILSKMIEKDIRGYPEVVKSIKRFQKRKSELFKNLNLKNEV